MTEREKMLAGEPYDPLDPELVAGWQRAQGAVIAFDREPDEQRRLAMLGELLGAIGERTVIVPPFFCTFGANIRLGDDCFMNAGGVILDSAAITIGDRTQVGPGVQILAADHPREPERRAAGIEFARPVTIGSNCWVGAGAIICPGVTVGDDSIIGAGSVVIRDVPARVMAAGTPAG